jgi:hypothetical protein
LGGEGQAKKLWVLLLKYYAPNVRIESLEISDIKNSNFPVATVGVSERSILLGVGSVRLGFGERF